MRILVYDSDSTTSSVLLASTVYTIVLRPTITSIVPASSPAAGGQTITVNGAGFGSGSVTAISAAIGGTALTTIKLAPNGNSFTATTAARAGAGGLALTVTTPGGTVSSLDPDNNGNGSDAIPFTYRNGITITPDNGAAGSTVTVDITGAGFGQLVFDAPGAGSPTNNHAHVFLVNGAYDSSANRGIAECGKVTVVSDAELVCTLDLSADQLSPTSSATATGQSIVEDGYVLTVVADGAIGSSGANPTIVSSGSSFVVGPF